MCYVVLYNNVCKVLGSQNCEYFHFILVDSLTLAITNSCFVQ